MDRQHHSPDRSDTDIMGHSAIGVLLPGSANRIGFHGNGGPFTLMQLKVIQEAVTLIVFTLFTVVFFNGEQLHWNHFAAFLCLIAAVWLVFLK